MLYLHTFCSTRSQNCRSHSSLTRHSAISHVSYHSHILQPSAQSSLHHISLSFHSWSNLLPACPPPGFANRTNDPPPPSRRRKPPCPRAWPASLLPPTQLNASTPLGWIQTPLGHARDLVPCCVRPALHPRKVLVILASSPRLNRPSAFSFSSSFSFIPFRLSACVTRRRRGERKGELVDDRDCSLCRD